MLEHWLTVNVISAMPLKNICSSAKKRKPAYRCALSMPSGAMWVRRNSVAQMILVKVACVMKEEVGLTPIVTAATAHTQTNIFRAMYVCKWDVACTGQV